jgi:uncharacterized membrane protein
MRARTVVVAAAFALALLALRAGLTGRPDFLFLVWNLALALIPVGLAIPERGGVPRLVLWWLFFPNAAYLVTDLVHLRPRAMPHWFDVGLFASFALAGLAASAWSLERMRGRVPSRWRFVFLLAVGASAGFAIWIGRFLRLNSWDPLLRPWRTLATIASAVAERPVQAVGVTLLFGGMLLVAHGLVERVGEPALRERSSG